MNILEVLLPQLEALGFRSVDASGSQSPVTIVEASYAPINFDGPSDDPVVTVPPPVRVLMPTNSNFEFMNPIPLKATQFTNLGPSKATISPDATTAEAGQMLTNEGPFSAESAAVRDVNSRVLKILPIQRLSKVISSSLSGGGCTPGVEGSNSSSGIVEPENLSPDSSEIRMIQGNAAHNTPGPIMILDGGESSALVPRTRDNHEHAVVLGKQCMKSPNTSNLGRAPPPTNSHLLTTLFAGANPRPKPTPTDCLLYWLLQDHSDTEDIPPFSKVEDGKSLFRLLLCLWAEPVVGSGPFDKEWKKLAREREIRRCSELGGECEVSVVSVLVMLSLLGAEFGFGLMRGIKPPKALRLPIVGMVSEPDSPAATVMPQRGLIEDTPISLEPRAITDISDTLAEPRKSAPIYASTPLDLLASRSGSKSKAANVALTLPDGERAAPRIIFCPVCKKSNSRSCTCAVSLLHGMGVIAPSFADSSLRTVSPGTPPGRRRLSGQQTPTAAGQRRAELSTVHEDVEHICSSST